jgi:DNA-binding transcriptional ArsR family regulator
MNKKAYNLFFGNLANPLKIEIISCLTKSSKSVQTIVTETGEEQSRISHALANLKKCKLVESKRNGKEQIYSLNSKTILPILNIIDQHAKTYCENTSCGECILK